LEGQIASQNDQSSLKMEKCMIRQFETNKQTNDTAVFLTTTQQNIALRVKENTWNGRQRFPKLYSAVQWT
jgi:hypothetical protein